MFDAVRKLRLDEELPIAQIMDRLGISKATASKYINQVESSLPDEQRAALRAKAQSGRKFKTSTHSRPNEVAILRNEIKRLQEVLSVSSLNCDVELSTLRKGIAAEYFVKYSLARRGIQFFEPPAQSEACDLLVAGAQGKYYRCEIKATTQPRGSIQLRHSTYHSDGPKRTAYFASSQIDFFILANLHYNVLGILPFKNKPESDYAAFFPGSNMWEYAERVDLFYGPLA